MTSRTIRERRYYKVIDERTGQIWFASATPSDLKERASFDKEMEIIRISKAAYKILQKQIFGYDPDIAQRKSTKR